MVTLLLLASACADRGGDSGMGPTGDLVLTDASTYRYTGALDAAVIEVEAATDARVDWGALATDIRGRALSGPEAVEQVALLEFYGSVEEIGTALSENGLQQSDIRDYRLFENDAGVSEAWLSEFAVLGNAFDPAADLVDNGGAWAVSLLVGPVTTPEVLSFAFVAPTVGAGNSEIPFTDETASLDFEVDLRAGSGPTTAEGLGYTLDWSAVTVDAVGNAFEADTAQRLMIGHVPVEDPAEVEAQFLQIYELADGLWRLDVYGSTAAELSQAVDEAGAAFPGFSVGGTWLVGLECPSCLNPAPPVLSVVEVLQGE